jgi:hypothetical protein
VSLDAPTMHGEVARVSCGCVWTRTERATPDALSSVEVVWSPCPTHLPGYVAAARLSSTVVRGLLGRRFPPPLTVLNEAASQMVRHATLTTLGLEARQKNMR